VIAAFIAEDIRGQRAQRLVNERHTDAQSERDSNSECHSERHAHTESKCNPYAYSHPQIRSGQHLYSRARGER